jgi:hypothetical protein
LAGKFAKFSEKRGERMPRKKPLKTCSCSSLVSFPLMEVKVNLHFK